MIGLVGGIGGGKSRLAGALGARGAQVIDADAAGHALLDRRAVRERLVARFGAGILTSDGAETIDRSALGAIVFANSTALHDLEAIVHPKMRRGFERTIVRAEREASVPAIVLDAAILFEAGWDSLCDRVVFVDAPRSERLARLSAQRGWSEAALAAREQSQWPLDEKRSRADFLLNNNSANADGLDSEVERIWKAIVANETSAPPDQADAARLKVPPSPCLESPTNRPIDAMRSG